MKRQLKICHQCLHLNIAKNKYGENLYYGWSDPLRYWMTKREFEALDVPEDMCPLLSEHRHSIEYDDELLTDAGAMRVLVMGGKVRSVHKTKDNLTKIYEEGHCVLDQKTGQLVDEVGCQDSDNLFGNEGWRWVEVKDEVKNECANGGGRKTGKS